MTRNRIVKLLLVGSLLALALSAPAPARAAGFLIYDVSAEALGKASAVQASSMEPAANWFNPANLAFMKGFGAQIGATFIVAGNRFTLTDSAGNKIGDSIKSETGFFTLPALYAYGKLGDRLALGVGVNTPWGLALEWPADWIGSENGIKASLQTAVMNLNVAYKLHPRVALAAGFNVLKASVDFTNGLPAAIGGGTVRLGGGTWGFGGNAAVTVKAIPDKLNFAVSYRSRVKLSFDGKADFTLNEPIFSSSLPDQGGKAAITIPDIISFGVMYRPIPKLEVTFDTNVVLWSTYDKLQLDFEQPQTPDESLPRNNKNAATFRLGVDWSGLAEGLHLRAGFIYDMNPAPKEYLSPTLPDANRVDFAAGVGYRWKWLKVDAGYLLVYFLKSEADGNESPRGYYNSIAHLTGVTVGFQLD